MTNKLTLKGKVALITGASGLLGVEHANALLELGATVVMTDIDKVGLDKAFNDLMSVFDKKNVIC